MDSSSDDEDITLSELAKKIKKHDEYDDYEDNIPLKKLVQELDNKNNDFGQLNRLDSSGVLGNVYLDHDYNNNNTVNKTNHQIHIEPAGNLFTYSTTENESTCSLNGDVIDPEVSLNDDYLVEVNVCSDLYQDVLYTTNVEQILLSDSDIVEGITQIDDCQFEIISEETTHDPFINAFNSAELEGCNTEIYCNTSGEVNTSETTEDLGILFPLFEEVTVTSEDDSFTLNDSVLDTNDTTSEENSDAASSEDNTIIEQCNPVCQNDFTTTDNDQDHERGRTRRRRRNTDSWKQVLRKRRRNTGEEYMSARGKTVPKREVKRPSCKCKFRCTSIFSEDDQNNIFHDFWKSSYGRQRDYILIHVQKRETCRKTGKESRRKYTYDYHLSKKDNQLIRVCKEFFLGTLSIGERTVFYTLEHQDRVRCEDKRGRKRGQSKVTEEEKDFIRQHILSFPVVESHYCRQSTRRKYLEKNLSIKKMYDLYTEKCREYRRTPQKYWLYDHIFSNEFNFGFHKPKKDICTFCYSFLHLSKEEKELKKDEFEKHLKRKKEAREHKQIDKERAEKDDSITVLNFDLQKVLITPKLSVSDAYYSRKLATYNFSIYEMTSKQVTCNVWWETEAKRGSCEIATCLYNFNKSIGPKQEVIYYSDSCTGQQRNLPFSTMCLYSVVNLPIERITHNYFERGHSQMEGDSVHATTERSTKNYEIFAPADWIAAIKNAKQSVPKYKIQDIKNQDIIDFKKCADSTISNRSKDETGCLIKWKNIHSFQYRKEEPEKIFFKYELDEDFKSFAIFRGRGINIPSLKGYKLKRLYNSKINISDKKYDDLNSLCSKNLIPSIHHEFYSNLPHGKGADILPEPDVNDDSDGEY